MEINFYKEKIYLEELEDCYDSKGVLTLNKSVKKSLRYQLVFLINEADGNLIVLDFAGKTKYSISAIITHHFGKVNENDLSFWVIRNRKTKFEKKPLYTEYEQMVIKKVISHFARKKTEITEKLCNSLGDEVLEKYYSSYGKIGLESFVNNLNNIPYHIENPFNTLTYGRSRYSVVDLLKDFSKTPDLQIYTDPDLVGVYERISSKRFDGSTMINDKWSKFVRIVGSRLRANLSIRTLSKVTVNIPENEVGVEPGEKELNSFRSFSIIADGKLNMKYLGIKTSNSRLTGKLKRLGVAEPLLYKGEFLLDLTRLPLTKKSNVSTLQLANAEYQIAKSKVVMGYLACLIRKQKLGLVSLPISDKWMNIDDRDDKTKFLNSIGIYGDMYYPKVTETESVGSYTSRIVEGKVSGIPADCYPNIRTFINTGRCKNNAINRILSEITAYRGIKDVKVLKKLYSVEENLSKRWTDILREYKFKLITGKTFILGKHYLEDIHYYSITDDVNVSWRIREVDILV